ncbi:hypothetical protein N431DRAFT_414424 [Stipitochalara longipes BDJ]|nr:hypothetical protein N431DRAFT_414424 [Stipitochalara longipes BDJ]
MDSPTAHSIAGGEHAGPGKNGKRKAKTFHCRFCSDTFHRLEHIQRHERTHTKEKPFTCATCGKAFARRDLVIRHEKLVHDVEPSKNSRRQSAVPNIDAPTPKTPQPFSPAVIQTSWGSQNPSSGPPGTINNYAINATQDSHLSPNEFFAGHINQPQSENISTLGSNIGTLEYAMTGAPEIPGDYNLFFDNFDTSNFYLPSTVFDSELPISLWSRPDFGGLEPDNSSRRIPLLRSENDALSRLGSRLPSLQPHEQDLMSSEPAPQADSLRAGPPWKISGEDYRQIQANLNEFVCVLPDGFTLPSRHTLSRFFEGYISGFHQHLPFLHIPTFSISTCAPELFLAIAAVGAQYRFESTNSHKLWYAAKSVASEQLKRRQSQHVADLLSSPTPSRASISKSPASHPSPQTPLNISRDNTHAFENNGPQVDIRSPSGQARLATIQTLLILMAMGMWGPPALLREGMIVQNQLALLIRDHGLHKPEILGIGPSWEDWILIEGDCRTKCIAYCFFNLQSISYDTAPVLRTPEMKINLPHSSDEWRARTAEEWQLARSNTPQHSLSFQDVLTRLFSTTQDDIPTISSLGNYVLIHAIIQQIYAVRQASMMASPSTRDGSLPPENIQKFEQVLRLWQIGWEKAPESSLDPTNPYGPVAFSSTALLRLAYVRLHCDLGPCRGLETRDPQIIARTLKASLPLSRSPLLSRAILQAAHALSIPVKIGIKFVANTHTLLWSMQHSLANLECAFLLSKWLYMIADCISELTVDERNLLEMVRSIVGETHYAIDHENSNGVNRSTEIKQLSVAVVRIWAEIFTGSQHIFPLVKVIGLALDVYADLSEADEVAG